MPDVMKRQRETRRKIIRRWTGIIWRQRWSPALLSEPPSDRDGISLGRSKIGLVQLVHRSSLSIEVYGVRCSP
jgi:hypothetical protein